MEPQYSQSWSQEPAVVLSWAWSSQSTPFPTLFFRTHFNIILPSTCRFYKFPQVSPPLLRMHLSSYAHYNETVQQTEGPPIREFSTSSGNILADQVIQITLFCTCQCTCVIRSGSNLVNNHDRRGVGWGVTSKYLRHWLQAKGLSII